MLKSMSMVRRESGWPWASHMAVWQAFLYYVSGMG